MAEPLVRFREDFLAFMREREALPKESAVKEWLQKNHLGLRSGYIGQLYAGKRLRVEHSVKWVLYILNRGLHDVSNHTFVALNDYLRMRTGADVSTYSPHSIAAIILEDDTYDYLIGGIDRFLKLFETSFALNKAVQGCKLAEVALASHWMFISQGRAFDPESSVKEAMAIAESWGGIPFADYTKSLTAWNKFDAWTVVFARHGRTKVGVSIVLPLKESAYDAIRAGKKHPDKLTNSDLQRPSRHIFIEGCAEIPLDCDGPNYNVSMYLNIAMMRQIGILSYCNGTSASDPLSVLAFGGTELNENRLRTTGFKKLAVRVPLTAMPLYEIVLPRDISANQAMFLNALLLYFGLGASSAIRPPK